MNKRKIDEVSIRNVPVYCPERSSRLQCREGNPHEAWYRVEGMDLRAWTDKGSSSSPGQGTKEKTAHRNLKIYRRFPPPHPRYSGESVQV